MALAVLGQGRMDPTELPRCPRGAGGKCAGEKSSVRARDQQDEEEGVDQQHERSQDLRTWDLKEKSDGYFGTEHRVFA